MVSHITACDPWEFLLHDIDEGRTWQPTGAVGVTEFSALLSMPPSQSCPLDL